MGTVAEHGRRLWLWPVLENGRPEKRGVFVPVWARVSLDLRCSLAPCHGASRGATCLSSRSAEAGYERKRQITEGVLFRQTQEHCVPVDCDDVQSTSRCDKVAGSAAKLQAREVGKG